MQPLVIKDHRGTGIEVRICSGRSRHPVPVAERAGRAESYFGVYAVLLLLLSECKIAYRGKILVEPHVVFQILVSDNGIEYIS